MGVGRQWIFHRDRHSIGADIWLMIGFRIVLVLASVCYLGALLAVLWLSNLSTDRDTADFHPSVTVESTS